MSCKILEDFVSLTSLKIVLPCRRELNFDKIVMFAFDTNFIDSLVISGSQKSLENSPK